MKYDKLVRDLIPQIIRENGESPRTHVADDDEFASRLTDKLEEEVDEFLEDGDVEELADILEVVVALGELNGVSEQELQRIREEKAADRGRFDDRIVLEDVDEAP